MALQIKSAADIAARGIRALVYGQSGAGKTFLSRTASRPIVLSLEQGLLSLQGAAIDYVDITTFDGLRTALTDVAQSDYQTVILDSVSEAAEILLSEELKSHTDPRQAYGELATKTLKLLRAVRDGLHGKDVICLAKCERAEDDTGRMLFAPSMPGKQLTMQLPHLFDEVWALRTIEKDKQNVQALMTQTDGRWTAKDRSGQLAQFEPADYGAALVKCKGAKP